MARHPITSNRALPLGLIALVLAACGEAAPDPPAQPLGDGGVGPGSEGEHRTYEQNFVFASVTADSTFLVPWLTRTTEHPDAVAREARGWLARSGSWDAFFAESWMTPTTRAPARMLPYGNMKLLIQEGDVVDGILFDDGTRRLELALGEVHATWGGPRGEAIDLVQGTAYLSDESVEGSILHFARASAGGAPPGGDWALLMSGDSVRVVLAADAEHEDETDPLYRAWADTGDGSLVWPEVHVEWSDAQAFPPARRDVPVSWTIWSEDETLEGQIDAVSAEIQPGPGPGPLLPVRALFEVAGDIYTSDGDYPVRGLLVHERR